MVLDGSGVILEMTVSGRELQRLNLKTWVGKPLLEMATLDSKEKLQHLLAPTDQNAASGWRHLNFSFGGEIDVPLQLLAFPQPTRQQWVVFGRDLSGVSQMQKRLVESHPVSYTHLTLPTKA